MQGWEAYWAPSESSTLTVCQNSKRAEERTGSENEERKARLVIRAGWEEHPIRQQKPLQLEGLVKTYFKYWKTTNVNHEQNCLSKLKEK